MNSSVTTDKVRVVKRPRRLFITTARLHVWLMVALTFSTGIVDAVGYLGLDRVFIGSMTGNVVILGMAVSGTTTLPVLGPALALAMFFVGAMLCGRMLRKRAEGWGSSISVAFILTTGVMLASSVVLMVVGEKDLPFLDEGIISALALSMGIQAAAARHIKVVDVTTVVVTSTITGLAADSRLGGNKGQNWIKRFLAILCILLGALCGATLLTVAMWLPILISAVLTGTVLIVGDLRYRAEQKENT